MLLHRQGAAAERMLCDELRSRNEAGVDDHIRPATRVPSRAMSSLASLVASIDERLAALRGEIDQLQQSRAALGGNATLADGATDRTVRPTHAPRATAAGTAAHRAKPARRSAPQTRAAGPARPPAGRPRRAAPRIAPLTTAAIEQLLRGRDTGLSARAIAERANADYARTLSLLRELEASGQVQREGSRRTTAWRLITDEDRIAQRAAELERLAGVSGTRQARPRGRARASR